MRTGKAKQPYCFEINEGELFAFAGIWDRWKDATGKSVETCSILTTTPNAVTAPVHDRMPVILDPDGYESWLDPGMRDASAASELLKPFDARLMRSYPVSTQINSVANDDEGCSAPVELVQIQDVCSGVVGSVKLLTVLHAGVAQNEDGFPPHNVTACFKALAKRSAYSGVLNHNVPNVVSVASPL